MGTPSTTDSAGRGPRMRRDDRREQLLDSAATLLVQRGPVAITMEGVAAEAGVSKALPYAHFDNATELLRSLRDRELDTLRDRLQAAVEGAEELEPIVAASVHAYFEVIRERGAVLVASLRGLPLDDDEAARRQNPAFFVDLYSTHLGMSREVAAVVSAVLVGGIDGAVGRWIDGTVSRAQAEAVLVRLAVAGATAVAVAERVGDLP